MAKISKMFQGSYLKTEDFDSEGRELTILEVTEERIGRGRLAEKKLVVYFDELEQGLPLNKVNATAIAKILSADDTDDWTGGRVLVRRDETEFQGEPVDCIRVTRPTSGKASDSGSGSGSGGDAKSKRASKAA